MKLGYVHKGMQGKIGEVKDRKEEVFEVHVYTNSSDFPKLNLLLLHSKDGDLKKRERVPITEEIWQKAGECLGYKFKRVAKKEVKHNGR